MKIERQNNNLIVEMDDFDSEAYEGFIFDIEDKYHGNITNSRHGNDGSNKYWINFPNKLLVDRAYEYLTNAKKRQQISEADTKYYRDLAYRDQIHKGNYPINRDDYGPK